MNKLEQRMLEAVQEQNTYEDYARIAAKIATEIAEEAYDAGWVRMSITGYNGTTDPQKTFKDGFEAFKQKLL